MAMIDANTITKLQELIGLSYNRIHKGDDHSPFMMVPGNAMKVDLEPLLKNPTRIRQNPKFQSMDSFVDYVTKFKTENSSIFATISDTGFSCDAILDYHTTKKANWGDHVASLNLEFFPVFKKIMAVHNELLPQVDFAEFIEANLMYISEPVPADFLELIQHIKGHRNIEFTSSERLDNGAVNLIYTENLKAGSTTGNMEIPGKIAFIVPLFYHGKPEKIVANFRWRVKDSDKKSNQIFFGYTLIGAQEFVQDRQKMLIEQLGVNTGIPIYWGKK